MGSTRRMCRVESSRVEPSGIWALLYCIVQIDKKGASRSRDNLVPLADVLASLKPSEFVDFQLARYKVLTRATEINEYFID